MLILFILCIDQLSFWLYLIMLHFVKLHLFAVLIKWQPSLMTIAIRYNLQTSCNDRIMIWTEKANVFIFLWSIQCSIPIVKDNLSMHFYLIHIWPYKHHIKLSYKTKQNSYIRDKLLIDRYLVEGLWIRQSTLKTNHVNQFWR